MAWRPSGADEIGMRRGSVRWRPCGQGPRRSHRTWSSARIRTTHPHSQSRSSPAAAPTQRDSALAGSKACASRRRFVAIVWSNGIDEGVGLFGGGRETGVGVCGGVSNHPRPARLSRHTPPACAPPGRYPHSARPDHAEHTATHARQRQRADASAAPAASPHSSAARSSPPLGQSCRPPPSRRRVTGANRAEHAGRRRRQLTTLGTAQIGAAERRAALRRQRDRGPTRPAPRGEAREHVVAGGREAVAAARQMRHGGDEVAGGKRLEPNRQRGWRRRHGTNGGRERNGPSGGERPGRGGGGASRAPAGSMRSAPTTSAPSPATDAGSPGTRSPGPSPATRIDSGPTGERAGASSRYCSPSRT